MLKSRNYVVLKPQKVAESIKITELYSMFEGFYSSSYEFAGESHNFWECVCVLDGAICVSADERVYYLKKDNIIFHKPMEFHKFAIESENEARLFVFSFSCSGELCESLKNSVFTLNDEQRKIIISLIEFCRKKYSEQNDTSVLDFCDGLYYLRAVKNDTQLIASYMNLIFLSLSKSPEAQARENSWDARLFTKAVDYMTSGVFVNLSVSDISKFCNISESGLKRIFKKYAGVGIHRYFIQIKIKKAIELLQGGCSVIETSAKLSYSSQAYFSAVFKRETGYPPSDIKIHK